MCEESSACADEYWRGRRVAHMQAQRMRGRSWSAAAVRTFCVNSTRPPTTALTCFPITFARRTPSISRGVLRLDTGAERGGGLMPARLVIFAPQSERQLGAAYAPYDKLRVSHLLGTRNQLYDHPGSWGSWLPRNPPMCTPVCAAESHFPLRENGCAARLLLPVAHGIPRPFYCLFLF